jgi:hypothetical protein
MRGQLQSLRFAAGERRCRLPQPQISEANLIQNSEASKRPLGTFTKKASASRTVNCSFMDIFPVIRTSSTPLLETRAAAFFANQLDVRQNCISTVTVPSPWHVSQRPPGTLKENARRIASLASGVSAKTSRMASNAF